MSLLKSKKNGELQKNNCAKQSSSKGPDNFDKDLIKTVVFNLFEKNECVTLKKLKSFLDKKKRLENFKVPAVENIT